MNLIRWTTSFLRPHRTRVGLIVLLSVVEIALNALAPWALTLIVDSVLGGRPPPAWVAAFVPALTGLGAVALLALFAAGGLALQVGAELTRLAHTQLEAHVGQRVVHELRNRLLAHLQAMPLTHHLTHRTSDAVYRLDADTYCINDLVTGGVFPIVPSRPSRMSMAFPSLKVMPRLSAGLVRNQGVLFADHAQRFCNSA